MFVTLLVSGMLLTPVLNVPVPVPLRSVDVYISLFLILSVLWTGFLKSLVNISIIPFLTLFALIAQMLALELVFGIGDSTGLFLSLRSIATVLAAICCSSLLWKAWGEDSLEIFFKVIIWCAIVQGMVLWLTFFSPDFRDMMSLIFHRDQSVGREHLILFRSPGFVSTGGDGLSLNQGILCTVAVLGVFYLYAKSFKRTFLLGAIIVANIGSAFTGRSGLYLASVLIALVILTYSNGKLRSRRIIYFFLFVAFFLLVLSIFSTQIGVYGLELLDEYGYEHPIVRLLRGFIEMSFHGGYKDRTILILLQDMVFFPQDPLRLLIGNNDFGQMPVNYIESDIGYVRMIHGFGLIGMACFFFGIFVVPVLIIYRSKISLQRRHGSRGREIVKVDFLAHCVLVILMFGIIAHWKLFYLSTRIFLYVFFVFLSLTYLKINSMQKRLPALPRSPQVSKTN